MATRATIAKIIFNFLLKKFAFARVTSRLADLELEK